MLVVTKFIPIKLKLQGVSNDGNHDASLGEGYGTFSFTHKFDSYEEAEAHSMEQGPESMWIVVPVIEFQPELEGSNSGIPDTTEEV